MRFSRVELTNWKNFTKADVRLSDRAFLIGPNASGKSNFLDALRFLHDLAAPGGGLQRACEERGGVSKIRCLAGRSTPGVSIAVELLDEDGTYWYYEISFTQKTQFPQPLPIIRREVVRHNQEILLERPNEQDREDERRLSQTALEQIAENKRFRQVADHFADILYLHLVPQLVRGAIAPGGTALPAALPDMYGGRLLEEIATTDKRTQRARLKKIEQALKIAVSQLSELELVRDERGQPHLEAQYVHWRPKAGRQDEQQFSDGTLRLIGLFWMLQKGSGLLLMEEPELSLHVSIVRRLAAIVHTLQARSKNNPTRQVMISTHSVDLLSDTSIGAEEILLFKPTDNGTRVISGADLTDVAALMEQGLTAGEAAMPHTEPSNIVQLGLGI